MNTFTPFAILSASRADTESTNIDRTGFLASQLKARGYDFARVVGCYRGKEEAAFIVLLDREDTGFPELTRLARRWGQESILHVDANRNAVLHFIRHETGGPDVNGQTQKLGVWRAVTEAAARALDAWTFNPATNLYYTAA
jgi:hypothetical protein